MNERWKRLWRRGRPWIVTLLVATAAFALGTWAGDDEPASTGSVAVEHAHAEREGREETGEVWTCAMHPQIRRPEPGQCPICGMDLIPLEEAAAEAADAPDRIQLSERAKTLARIRTQPVRKLGQAHAERRLLGRVEPAETRMHKVTAWIDGRIDRLHVQATGQRIRKGQVIATLYSPQVYAAHQDLLQAKQQIDMLSKATPTARKAARAAFEAARTKLRLLGIPNAELERMLQAGSPWRKIPIHTPYAGTVLHRSATEGQYVDVGTPLYEVADLSVLWVQLDAYESDLPYLQEGQTVSLDAKALSGVTLEGKVAFVDPVIDPRTRTTQVRIQVSNRERELRPGMFVEAVLEADVAKLGDSPLVIPDTAPLFTGRRSLVYVELQDVERPIYEARVVKLGPRIGEAYTVVAGLHAGERVVTHGAFVIDADVQIRGGPSMMALPDDTQQGPYDRAIPVSQPMRAQLAPVMKAYLDIQRALRADDLDAARVAARRLQQEAKSVSPSEQESARQAWSQLGKHLRQRGKQAAAADSLSELRGQFRHLSVVAVEMLQVFGNPLRDPLHVAFCPMASDGDGARWVQRASVIENPYFGTQMHACGEIRSRVHPGGYLTERPKAQAGAAAGGHSH